MSDALFTYGIGYITENRKGEGLFLDEPVITNLTLLVWRKMRDRWTGYITRRKEKDTASAMATALSVRAPNLGTPVGNLSGGNQQKISIGRWLLADCEILIIDEPTVGVDVASKEQIYQLIWNLAYREREGVILISSDMAEIILLSTRVLVFREHEIIGQTAHLDGDNRSYTDVRDEIVNLLSADLSWRKQS